MEDSFLLRLIFLEKISKARDILDGTISSNIYHHNELKCIKLEILNKDVYSFLSFSDYFKGRKYQTRDWVTVVRMDPASGKDPMLIFSVLIDKKDVDKVLKSEGWEIDNLQMGEDHFEFGYPYFVRNEGKIDYIEGWGISNDMVVEPFIFYRLNDGNYKTSFEILQNFVLYHNLRTDNKGNYVIPDTQDIVIKIINPEHIVVRTHYLKDYLAARKKILVSYIEFDRTYPISINKVITTEKYEEPIKQPDGIYKLTIKKSVDPNKSFSWIRGKEIIFPYSEPLHDKYKFLTGKHDEIEYEEIKIGLDEKGEPIFSKCGIDGDIRSCFFRKELLVKYQEDHENYTVDGYTVQKHNGWVIPYGINDEDIIHVYLKDLGNLPISEQKYWGSFNELPRGGLNKGFFKRQMECKYTASDNKIDVLLTIKEKVNQQFEEIWF